MTGPNQLELPVSSRAMVAAGTQQGSNAVATTEAPQHLRGRQVTLNPLPEIEAAREANDTAIAAMNSLIKIGIEGNTVFMQRLLESTQLEIANRVRMIDLMDVNKLDELQRLMARIHEALDVLTGRDMAEYKEFIVQRGPRLAQEIRAITKEDIEEIKCEFMEIFRKASDERKTEIASGSLVPNELKNRRRLQLNTPLKLIVICGDFEALEEIAPYLDPSDYKEKDAAKNRMIHYAFASLEHGFEYEQQRECVDFLLENCPELKEAGKKRAKELYKEEQFKDWEETESFCLDYADPQDREKIAEIFRIFLPEDWDAMTDYEAFIDRTSGILTQEIDKVTLREIEKIKRDFMSIFARASEDNKRMIARQGLVPEEQEAEDRLQLNTPLKLITICGDYESLCALDPYLEESDYSERDAAGKHIAHYLIASLQQRYEYKQHEKCAKHIREKCGELDANSRQEIEKIAIDENVHMIAGVHHSHWKYVHTDDGYFGYLKQEKIHNVFKFLLADPRYLG